MSKTVPVIILGLLGLVLLGIYGLAFALRGPAHTAGVSGAPRTVAASIANDTSDNWTHEEVFQLLRGRGVVKSKVRGASLVWQTMYFCTEPDIENYPVYQ